MSTILVVDDDHGLYALLDEFLRDEGFVCLHAATAEQGLRLARSSDVDVLILDVMLPGMSGFEVLRLLRGEDKTRELPVIMLTARDEEIDRVLGLELGADDYLCKPFSPRELVARLRALLRRLPAFRSESPVAAPLTVGDLVVNRSSLSIIINGVSQQVTVPEIRLLCMLVREPGQIVTREALYAEIFGHPAYAGDRSLDMLVSRVRKKLGSRPDGGERIKTARGEGYLYLAGKETG